MIECSECKATVEPRLSKTLDIEKGKRVYYCYTYCPKCGHVFRTWKEG